MPNKKKMVSKTLRLPEDLIRRAYKVSEEREIPFSTIVIQSLRRFIEFEIFTEIIHPVILSATSLLSILDLVTNEQMEQAGSRAGSTVLSSLFAHHNIKPSLDALLKYHIMPMSMYSGWFEAKYHEDDKKIALHHALGIKWSYWLKGHMGASISSVLKTEPRIEVGENSVIIYLK